MAPPASPSTARHRASRERRREAGCRPVSGLASVRARLPVANRDSGIVGTGFERLPLRGQLRVSYAPIGATAPHSRFTRRVDLRRTPAPSSLPRPPRDGYFSV
jgi:hypothetical protein